MVPSGHRGAYGAVDVYAMQVARDWHRPEK
jgi:hypothetical protein